MGYVLGLVATLGAAGAIATTANADGSSVSAASGSGAASAASVAGTAKAASAASAAGSASAASATSAASASGAAAPVAGASESGAPEAGSGTSESGQIVIRTWVRHPRVVVRRHVAKEKIMRADKKMRGHDHYRDGSRIIRFKKGVKGSEVVLRNRKGREIEHFRIRRNGRFEIKLSKREARDLRKGGKYFTFTVHEKGYRAYTVRYRLYK